MEKLFIDIVERKDMGIDTNERYIYQYPIIMTYLKKKICGWTFWDFFNNFSQIKVAMYAVTEFTELLLNDYKNYNGKCRIENIVDQNYVRFRNGYKGYRVISPSELVEMKQKGAIDLILNCSIFHENEIYESLMKNGIEQEDIISINSVIFEQG